MVTKLKASLATSDVDTTTNTDTTTTAIDNSTQKGQKSDEILSPTTETETGGAIERIQSAGSQYDPITNTILSTSSTLPSHPLTPLQSYHRSSNQALLTTNGHNSNLSRRNTGTSKGHNSDLNTIIQELPGQSMIDDTIIYLETYLQTKYNSRHPWMARFGVMYSTRPSTPAGST